MSAVQPGWYPDPSDAAQLRYWDGTEWTANTAPLQGAVLAASSEGAYVQPGYVAPAQSAYAPQGAYAQSGYAQPGYSQPGYAQPAPATVIAPGAVYAMTDSDRTMRMIAFIFNLLSLIASCWLIIPLAWTIPMTLRSWGIYKGTKPNTVAFAVCDLLFLSVVGGVLLLISQKDA